MEKNTYAPQNLIIWDVTLSAIYPRHRHEKKDSIPFGQTSSSQPQTQTNAMARVRHSIYYIQYLYDSGEDRSKLENLVRAFRGIQALPPTDINSFFHMAGFHGLPYRGPGATNQNWWGGYCWHATVLFPTWHRAYLLRVEDALRSIPRCQDVTLPFWDELAAESVPSIFTSPTFSLDGNTIDNPLYSYKLQEALRDKVEEQRYTKPRGYETVRYPLSGLVGTETDKERTRVHNAQFTQSEATQKLNDNVKEWLLGTVNIPDRPPARRPDTYSVGARFWRCLNAPNYTVFSNTASQNQWIQDLGHEPESHYVVSLESPHNAIHLAVGGFYQEGVYNASPIRDANGDMGANEVAGFDPIFFFHHCFVDYVFARWQELKNLTRRGSLTVFRGYPGTVLEETDGQPPNFAPGTILDMTTPLLPFQKPSGEYYTSDDVTDLNDLGITYGPGSMDITHMGVDAASLKYPINLQLLDSERLARSKPDANNPFVLTKWVHNIDRAQYAGSFVIRLYAQGYDGKEVEVGREAVLSRWDLKGCLNCQNHLDVDFYVPIDAVTLNYFQGSGEKAAIKWRVEIHTHDKLHNFPISVPGEGRTPKDGEPEGPKVDDL